VQADRIALVLGLVDLEELAIRVELNGEQVGRIEGSPHGSVRPLAGAAGKKKSTRVVESVENGKHLSAHPPQGAVASAARCGGR